MTFVVTLALMLLVVIGAAATLGALGARPNLGLDLQGGISAIYTRSSSLVRRSRRTSRPSSTRRSR